LLKLAPYTQSNPVTVYISKHKNEIEFWISLSRLAGTDRLCLSASSGSKTGPTEPVKSCQKTEYRPDFCSGFRFRHWIYSRFSAVDFCYFPFELCTGFQFSASE